MLTLQRWIFYICISMHAPGILRRDHGCICDLFHLPLQAYPESAYPVLQLHVNDPTVLVHIWAHGPNPPFGEHSLISAIRIGE